MDDNHTSFFSMCNSELQTKLHSSASRLRSQHDFQDDFQTKVYALNKSIFR